jgi:hypothetical protein
MAKEIYNLNGREEFLSSVKLADLQNHVTKLLGLLRERELPDYVVDRINEGVTKINEFKGDYKELGKLILKFSRETLTFLEKELKLVSKNHYQNQWMAIGLAAFGVPLGVAFGTSLGNMAFMGIGLPIGLALGLGVGASMDKKALGEGRQLDIDPK